MFASIKSEFRKLLTVRSTYVIVVISLLIVGLFAGYGDGFRATPDSLNDPGLFMHESLNAIVFIGLILAFAGLLLVGHEYRYNTIMYTLTSSNRRLKVLVAKLVAISTFAAVTSLMVVFFSPLCTIVGAHLHGNSIGPQHFDYWTIIWRCIFVGWGYSMYAFALITAMRSQVGSIVTFLLIPLIGENILGNIFRHAQKYFPFTSLQSVAVPLDLGNHTTSAHAALITLAYIIGGLAVGAVLFLKRDAN